MNNNFLRPMLAAGCEGEKVKTRWPGGDVDFKAGSCIPQGNIFQVAALSQQVTDSELCRDCDTHFC